MTRLLTRSVVATLVTVLAAAPALAHTSPPPGGGCRVIRGAETPDPSDDVSVCRQNVYFHKGSAPLGNLAVQNSTAIPSWNTTRPDGTLADAGAYVASSELDIAESGGPSGRPRFKGSFTGPLDTLGFRMYLRAPMEEVLGPINAIVYLEVDGAVLHDNLDAGGIKLPIVAEEGFYRLDATFRNLYTAMESQALDLTPTAEHSITFGIVSWTAPREAVFVYDADEAAAGMFFNLEPTSMAGFTKIDLAA